VRWRSRVRTRGVEPSFRAYGASGQSSARARRPARVSTCVHTLVVASRWGVTGSWENPGVNALEVIGRKRDGAANTPEGIRFLLGGYLDGSVPDYQMAAWLMAVCTRGMDSEETLELTRAMVDTGEVLDLSSIEGVKVDKHSTGGVGDKVTLVAGPIAAACGVRVPKLSGRALAHTGGTIPNV